MRRNQCLRPAEAGAAKGEEGGKPPMSCPASVTAADRALARALTLA